MNKHEEQIGNYYRRMKHTLERCAGILKMESDTELLCLIYDELAIDVRCDLCDANLESMLEYNYIYPEMAERIAILREDLAELMNTQRTAAEIRNTIEWKMAAEDAADVIEMLYI